MVVTNLSAGGGGGGNRKAVLKQAPRHEDLRES